MEKDLGKIKKNDTSDIVIRIDDFGGRKGLTIREFVTSEKYTGFTKDEVHDAMRLMFLLDKDRKMPTLFSTIAKVGPKVCLMKSITGPKASITAGAFAAIPSNILDTPSVKGWKKSTIPVIAGPKFCPMKLTTAAIPGINLSTKKSRAASMAIGTFLLRKSTICSNTGYVNSVTQEPPDY